MYAKVKRQKTIKLLRKRRRKFKFKNRINNSRSKINKLMADERIGRDGQTER